MIKIFDGMVDGKHVEKWQFTEEEKTAALAKIEELKKKRQDKNQTREVVENPEDKPKVEKAKKSTKRAKGKKK